jgi:hypothetical protein
MFDTGCVNTILSCVEDILPKGKRSRLHFMKAFDILIERFSTEAELPCVGHVEDGLNLIGMTFYQQDNLFPGMDWRKRAWYRPDLETLDLRRSYDGKSPMSRRDDRVKGYV